MKTTFRRHNAVSRHLIAAAIAMAVSAMSAVAAMTDLPVKSVNGRQMYYYVVRKGETVYSLTHTLGITHDQLVKSNRSVEDGLRAGQVLYFPVAEFGGKAVTETAPTSASASKVILHTVSKGETLYGVSHRYNVPVSEIIRLNPEAEKGLRAGQTLKVPMTSAAQVAAVKPIDTADNTTDSDTDVSKPTPARPVASKPATAAASRPIVTSAATTSAADQATTAEQPTPSKKIQPIEEPTLELTPVRGEIVRVDQDRTEADNATSDKATMQHHRIALMLPLCAAEKPTRQSALATDFYRGALLAVKDFSETHPDSIDLKVYDTTDGNFYKNLTSLHNVDIVITPDDEAKIERIALYTGTHGIPAFNSFIVKDSTYISTPGMMQTYIGQERMYAKAIDYVAEILTSPNAPTPVILNNENGRKDKLNFVTRLKERLDREGIQYITLDFDGNLHKDILEDKLPTSTSYFFITISGHLAEYNKIASGLVAFAESLVAEGNTLTTFGYPEWISFRGEAQDKLSKIGALYYSRFYLDKDADATKRLIAEFRRWYDKAPADGIPVQAILGYDSMLYILTALHEGNAVLDRPYHGIQSSYNFVHTPGIKGSINDVLYIIRYIAGATTPSVTIL